MIRGAIPAASVGEAGSGTRVSAPTSAEVRREGSNSGLPTPGPVPKLKRRYLAYRYAQEGAPMRLELLSASEEVDSLWSAAVTPEKFFPKGSLSTADQAMIESAGPMGSFDAAQIFLQRGTTIVDY
ncbi:uncharacterized protein LOC114915104 [Cajanus cajan]|uniref:uncharacterized protein LOC114915104 n=1 Tax=Cajanus cajan TaxID=3821 RepID=UPI0010FB1D3D|nr:uncharacterized protein LOC114915104 [Cajanus cajan]